MLLALSFQPQPLLAAIDYILHHQLCFPPAKSQKRKLINLGNYWKEETNHWVENLRLELEITKPKNY